MKQTLALTVHALHGGGAERLMSELATRWSLEHNVHLITWSSVDSDTYQVPEGVQRHGLGLLRPSSNPLMGILANWQRVRALRHCLKSIQPNFLLSFCDQMNILTLQASRGLGVPRWISEHSNPARQNLGLLWEVWRKQTYPTCDGCIVLSQSIADWMSHIVPAEKLTIIPPSIPDPLNSATTEANDEPAAQQPKQERRQCILFVGRLSSEKRVDLLIAAWKKINENLPEWSLEIVGSGEREAALKSSVQDADRVHFHGWSNNPQAHYQQASLFALSSDYEGFPLAMLEAMSFGLPCAATDCAGALSELASRCQCLLLSPIGDVDSLANNLLRLAAEEGRRLELAVEAQQIASEFQWSNVGKLWDAILE
jgi:GalNAc-alpha-(1->4)-GalNAc-alpha-(1->3)-diNAcBac-PP-undecaprenol alpha-1,4-N-acetyl-D-galactosaminyltransferase